MTDIKSWDNTWGQIDWEKENTQDICKQIDQLIASGANINTPNKYEQNVLIYSAVRGRNDVMKKLIAMGADCEKRDKEQNTALIWAAKMGHPECIETLLTQGSDINARNQYGQTPLIAAAFWGRTECLKVLIENGADLNAKDDQGNTALSTSIDMSNLPCIEALIIARETGKQLELSVSSPEFRAQQRDSARIYQEKIKRLYANLAKTTPERHALAVKLNEMRKEFGCKAKHHSADSRIIQELRKKIYTR